VIAAMENRATAAKL